MIAVASGVLSAALLLPPWLLVNGLPLFLLFQMVPEQVRQGRIGWSWPVIVCLATGFLLAHPFGFAYARFCLRCSPLNEDGTRRSGVVVAFALMVASSFGLLLLIVMGGIRDSGILLAFGPSAVVVLVAGAVALRVHLTPKYYLAYPFVLYLRRFSTFADRATLAQVLKGSPRGVPVVFIASPSSQPRNWDSFMWAFAGLRWFRPWRSLPVHVRSSDQNWEGCIERMIRHASVVVIDISSFSGSLRTEVRLIDQSANSQRVVWLRAARDNTPIDWGGLGLAPPTRLVCYEASYFAAIPGLLFKLLLVGMTMMVATTLLGVDAENPQGVLWTMVKGPLATIAGMLVMAFIIFYTRPAITRASVRAVRTAMSDALRVSGAGGEGP